VDAAHGETPPATDTTPHRTTGAKPATSSSQGTKPVNRTELAGHLSVSAESADALGDHMWADLMREASATIKNDGQRIHDLNEQLINVRAELQMLQHVINNQ
jgi:hypothetical protein